MRKDERISRLAENLIKNSVKLKKGEQIYIEAIGLSTMPLVQELVKAATKAGGVPFYYFNEQALQKAFIVLSKSDTMIKNLNKHELVYKAFKSGESLNMILHTLQQIVDSKKVESETACLRNKIINELQTIGFNLAHKGTHYLAESVVLLATTEKNNENLSKHIYPIVSKIFNKDLNNIKCNITSATEAACKNITDDVLLNYFKLSTRVKPTTKMIIYSILKKLR